MFFSLLLLARVIFLFCTRFPFGNISMNLPSILCHPLLSVFPSSARSFVTVCVVLNNRIVEHAAIMIWRCFCRPSLLNSCCFIVHLANLVWSSASEHRRLWPSRLCWLSQEDTIVVWSVTCKYDFCVRTLCALVCLFPLANHANYNARNGKGTGKYSRIGDLEDKSVLSNIC